MKSATVNMSDKFMRYITKVLCSKLVAILSYLLQDSNGRVEVYLGYWSESDHRTWFERTGRRKQSKL